MLGKRVLVGAIVGAAGAVLPMTAGHAAIDPGSGTHGCVVADINGTPAPIVYPNSGTSQIGGNMCTYTQVAGATVPGGAGGYVAAAQSWSITSCVPVSPAVCNADPAHSYSSSAGSVPVGSQTAIPAGDQVTVIVHNGFVIAGTPNGQSGA